MHASCVVVVFEQLQLSFQVIYRPNEQTIQILPAEGRDKPFDISVTHEALGPVRVMRTCGCMGELVGMAASLCKQHDCNPRAVYQQHLDELKQLMTRGVGKQASQTVP